MTDELHWFDSYISLPLNLLWAIETLIGHKCFVKGTRDICILVQLPHCTEIYLLKNVLYIPDFG
jgi:hypothetical protein